MKYAVVTLCIGDVWKEMSELTHPTIKKYADKINAEFVIINKSKLNLADPGFEKLQLIEILKYYDRVIYLDTDLIVMNNCPNLFDVVPEDALGAFIEDQYWMISKEVDHRERIIQTQKRFRDIGWVIEYINTGVMILGKKHIEIFSLPSNYIVDLREQTQLNYNIKYLGYWIHDIGLRFNKMDFMNPLDRFDSYTLRKVWNYGYYPKNTIIIKK